MITTADGVVLEGAWSEPAGESAGVAVLCHPHPLEGGTMNAPLMRMLAAELARAGLHVLRFNFRGVGASQGVWGEGVNEVLDVAAAAAFAAAAQPGLPCGVVGWSFGATTSLRWHTEHASGLPWVGIAPGIHPYHGATVPQPTGPSPGRRLIVVGDRDQFTTVDEVRSFAGGFGAEVAVVPGADHFFFHREDRVVDLVAGWLGAGG